MGIFDGISDYFKIIGKISQYRLWGYIWLPGLLSILLSTGLIWGAVRITSGVDDWVQRSVTGISWLAWLDEVAYILAILLIILLVLILMKYLIMVLIAPFMSMLSEKLESVLTGKPAPTTNLVQFMSDIQRGLRIALRNIVWELLLTIFFLLLNIIPVAGTLLCGVCTFLVQSYYAGFGNMDYTLERKRFSVKDSVVYVKRHRGLAIGNGAVFLVIWLIPVLGWFLAPAYGTMAATLSILRTLDRKD